MGRLLYLLQHWFGGWGLWIKKIYISRKYQDQISYHVSWILIVDINWIDRPKIHIFLVCLYTINLSIYTLIMRSLSVVRSKIPNPCDPALGIPLLWLAVMLFNQMSNSTGLWCTRQPWNAALNERDLCAHTNKHTETHTHVRVHAPTHAYTLNPFLLRSLSFLVNNFDIRNSPSIVSACVCVCVSAGNRKGKKSSLERLVYVLVIYTPSALYIRGKILTFQKLPCHFRNNWPALVLSRLHVQ